ncbi:MAG: orotidine-5'-phosphate decarboxylase [Proteobacteria bacterium]|nr:orotidine-5'-phosphate decarboxylase [Pseudomonadota bacterium]MDA0926913.1 orotidine-5'-phosphate decarboxylase [Pseudomonadota bacterium]
MEKPIIIAMDFDTEESALALLDQLDPQKCRVKIGKELFTLAGPQFVRNVIGRGFDVFLDLKFHDIPNTVARASKVAADLGVWMLNVHASGGRAMMEETRKALAEYGNDKPLLIAVTVLTSLAESDLKEVGVDRSPLQQVSKLAALTRDCGLDGVVCSAAEASDLRAESGSDFILVTPGIRRPEDAMGDQKRVIGPAEAMRLGSSYLVVGRPITRAESPLQALDEFNSAVTGIR